MEIKNLENTSLDVIVDCLVKSFEGYFVQLPGSLEYWEERFQIARVDLQFSFGMFDDGQLVGFIIQGIDNFAGKPTAFNTGTGVLPDYRGRHIVDDLYEVAKPILKQHGIFQCRLEVIEDNTKGIRVYERIGLNIERKLFCYKGEITYIHAKTVNLKKNDNDLSESDYNEEGLYSWDHTPNAIIAAGKIYDTYTVYGDEQKPLGYFTINGSTGYIARIEKTCWGSYDELIGGISKVASVIKINNVPENRTGLRSALLKAGLVNIINQYEMGMKL